MKVKEILEKKGSSVIAVKSENTVHYAIRLANDQKIGALLVMDDEKLVGIITERDILRECYGRSHLIEKTRVNEIMTKNLIVGIPEDEVKYLMGIMTKNKIRHMPIMNHDRVAGMVSIGDLVYSMLEEVEFQNRHLEQYIQTG